jgi:carboxypeptidase Taq
MEAKLKDLKTRLMEINDLHGAASLLYWDQATYMPAGGAEARGRQIATLERLAHEKFTDPAMGKLLEELRSYGEDLPYDSDEASLIRVTARDYEREVKIPPAFTEELTKHLTASYEAWVKARPKDDFSIVQPYLERTLDLSRQMANYFPGYEHIADPLIDYEDYGMKASTLQALFDDLRKHLVPMVEDITSGPAVDDSCLREHFQEAKQLAFGLEIIERFGYDFHRGRQDKTPHPFMTKFSLGDIRITTRVNENFLSEALFGAMHEAGHAMYEQGINMDYEGTPLADGCSAGAHEAQSRLWENLVGRSKGFWQSFFPPLQKKFPDQLKSVSVDTFYRAINKVERSLIRTAADEVTYNLHVMIRFGLELELLEGQLSVSDLPEAWRQRYRSDLGIASENDRDGVLQDMHWYSSTIGGKFQGYTLGNIMGAQFYAAALKAHPEISDEIAQGRFETLLEWLRENIYRHGNKYTPNELVDRVTGGPLSIEPYIGYLQKKFGEIYELR